MNPRENKSEKGGRCSTWMPIAEAMGVKYLKAQNLLKQTREILRGFFNHDGRLFAEY